MANYIFRLATTADDPAIRRLQTLFVTELSDPQGIDEITRPYTEFFVLEVADHDGCRVVGMTSLLRASGAPFVFERVFPDAWQHAALPAWLARRGIQRHDLVESDWGYIEKSYRGQGMALLLFAGAMLHARHYGYAACAGIANHASLARIPPHTLHATGLVTHLAGVRYELVLFAPAEMAPTMSEIIHAARVRDTHIVWQLPAGDAAPWPRRRTSDSGTRISDTVRPSIRGVSPRWPIWQCSNAQARWTPRPQTTRLLVPALPLLPRPPSHSFSVNLEDP